MIDDGVQITRATRTHPDLRRGSSVRGAIDLVSIAVELVKASPAEDDRMALMVDAALLALSARVAVDEVVDRTPESVISEICENHFLSRAGAQSRARST